MPYFDTIEDAAKFFGLHRWAIQQPGIASALTALTNVEVKPGGGDLESSFERSEGMIAQNGGHKLVKYEHSARNRPIHDAAKGDGFEINLLRQVRATH